MKVVKIARYETENSTNRCNFRNTNKNQPKITGNKYPLDYLYESFSSHFMAYREPQLNDSFNQLHNPIIHLRLAERQRAGS